MSPTAITFQDLVQRIRNGLIKDGARVEQGLVHIFGPASYTTFDTRSNPATCFNIKTQEPTVSCTSFVEGLSYGKDPFATIDALLADVATIGFTLMDPAVGAYIEQTGFLHVDAGNRPQSYSRGDRKYTIFTGAQKTSEGIFLIKS